MWLSVVIQVAMSIFCIIYGEKFDEMPAWPNTDYIKQLRSDWTTQPITDVQVVEGVGCGSEQDDVLVSIWYGSDLACDCLDVCAMDSAGIQMDGCYTMNLGQACDGP